MFAEGAGCNNNNAGGGCNMRDLDINQPASGGEEEEFPMGSVEEDEEERGVGGPHRPKKLRLSKEQSRLLEERFRLNHTLTPVSVHCTLTSYTSLPALPFSLLHFKFSALAYYSMHMRLTVWYMYLHQNLVLDRISASCSSIIITDRAH